MHTPQFATRALGKAQLQWHQNGSTILTVSGTIGFAAAAVLSGIAAVKAQGVVEDMRKRAQVINERANVEGWDEKDRVKAVVNETMPGLKRLAVIYAPPVIIGVASGVAILAGHGMMLKQRAGLVAAYAALDSSFRAYRNRISEEYGEEVEERLYHDRNWRKADFDDEENQVCEINLDPRLPSQYGRFFDETSRNWNKSPEYNLTFLTQQQQYANNRLQARGYLFLSDVYKALGFEESQASRQVGWLYKGDGDGYVDFGIHSIGDPNSRAFVNGFEPVVFLDFNVDGIITIPEKRK